ncbi:glycoside hydrolase family 16 protein [Mycena olivaceomarginata]|nr:glycoside hydrolase family 16 protein [Mycena olivaceomarginata]
MRINSLPFLSRTLLKVFLNYYPEPVLRDWTLDPLRPGGGHTDISPDALHEARTIYTLKDHYTGEDFLKWNFFTAADPTHGTVNYLSLAEAHTMNLAYGTTILAVDSTSQLSPGENRNSVRISSPNSYTYGLFVADIWAMPHGPTVWPAYWTVGPNWPDSGEIGLRQGTGDSTTNQMTLHTSGGCSLDTAVTSQFTGTPTTHRSCASSGDDNDGCGITDFAADVYGHSFKPHRSAEHLGHIKIDGGVYAHLVGPTGIKIWHFPRTSIPGDITAKTPNPANWGKPVAFWSSSTCDIASHFQDQVITVGSSILPIKSAFDYVSLTQRSAVIGPEMFFPGGMSACVEAVANPVNFVFAKWKLNYVSVYES